VIDIIFGPYIVSKTLFSLEKNIVLPLADISFFQLFPFAEYEKNSCIKDKL
jgi:hypothetical protein